MIISKAINIGHKNTSKATASSFSLVITASRNPTTKYAIAIPTATKNFILTTP